LNSTIQQAFFIYNSRYFLSKKSCIIAQETTHKLSVVFNKEQKRALK